MGNEEKPPSRSNNKSNISTTETNSQISEPRQPRKSERIFNKQERKENLIRTVRQLCLGQSGESNGQKN